MENFTFCAVMYNQSKEEVKVKIKVIVINNHNIEHFTVETRDIRYNLVH